MLSYAADLAEISPYWFRIPHEDLDEVRSGVVVADFDDLPAPGPGCRSATHEGGTASLRFLDEAIAAHQRKRIDAIVTGPIHKISWKMAGVKHPGHTEYIADAYRSRRVTMAFVGGKLRVALASTHVGLFELRNSFTIGRVFQPIDLLDDWLRRCWNIEQPRIAVCGLNPHAGEEARFGDEEARIIEPAMVMAGELGIHVEGPFPADTLFVDAAHGKYDGVVAMYHDQGPDPGEIATLRFVGECDAWPAGHSHQRGSRYGIRYRRPQPGQSGQYEGRLEAGLSPGHHTRGGRAAPPPNPDAAQLNQATTAKIRTKPVGSAPADQAITEICKTQRRVRRADQEMHGDL